MGFQIDQSGKIEDTAKASVVAATNSQNITIYLPAKEKRRLQEFFRRVGKPRMFVSLTFAAVLSILIKDLVGSLVIDDEYPGHSRNIEKLINLFLDGESSIRWKPIGKNSSAHDLAYKALTGKRKPTQTLTADKIWKLVTKKAGGYLNAGLSPANRYSSPGFVRKTITKKRRMSR